MISATNRHVRVTKFRKQRRTSTGLISTRLAMSINIRGTIFTRYHRRLKYVSTVISVSNSRNIKTHIPIICRQKNMVKLLHPLMRRKHEPYTTNQDPNRPAIIIRPAGLIFRRSRHYRYQHIRHLVLTKVLSNQDRKGRQEGPTTYTQGVRTFNSTMNTFSYDKKRCNGP